jgi:hypothetical protein
VPTADLGGHHPDPVDVHCRRHRRTRLHLRSRLAEDTDRATRRLGGANPPGASRTSTAPR